ERQSWLTLRFFVVSSSPEELGANLEAALEWLGAYFVNESPLHRAAEELAGRLEELGIDYAVAGALSLAAYGFLRGTENVDVLLTRNGLDQRRLPGRRRAQPVSFPDPREAGTDAGKFRELSLPRRIE